MTGNPPDDSTSPVPAASGPGPHDAARPRERLLPSVPAAERTAPHEAAKARTGPAIPAAPTGTPTRREDSMAWAPCTLPVAERPLRVAEFDGLFAAALRGLARPEPTLVRLWLDGSDEVAAATRELVARESACCSFFEFTLDRTSDHMLLLGVRVPSERVAVLDGLAARAASTAGVRSA